MESCTDCRLSIEDAEASRSRCAACVMFVDTKRDHKVKPMNYTDLELVYAWRSMEDVYRYFRQQDGPLDWTDHVDWFESRPGDRHDFMIVFKGRRVGVVSLDTDEHVSIYIGDHSARGEGVASRTLAWLTRRFRSRTPIFAEIHADNDVSRRFFEAADFHETDRDEDWLLYAYDP